MTHPVKAYYDANARAEADRLDLPLCRVEFLSTLGLIGKYFPPTGDVCDVGGGPGRYTLELTRRGYRCRLVDISEMAVQIAQASLAREGFSGADASVGDATDLSHWPAGHFAAGLLLGPMYHLVAREHRRKALDEFHRVLKEGAIGIVAFINSWGLLKSGIADFPSWFARPDFAVSLLGPRAFTASEMSGFTECFWTTPVEAQRELEDSGFEVVSYAGAESFAAGMGSELAALKSEDVEMYERIVQDAARMCELPPFRDNTDHLHVVVRARGDIHPEVA